MIEPCLYCGTPTSIINGLCSPCDIEYQRSPIAGVARWIDQKRIDKIREAEKKSEPVKKQKTEAVEEMKPVCPVCREEGDIIGAYFKTDALKTKFECKSPDCPAKLFSFTIHN